MSDPSHSEALMTNMQHANEHLQNLQGEQPTDVAIAGATIAQAFLLAALVNAVQELTDEIRKAREQAGKLWSVQLQPPREAE